MIYTVTLNPALDYVLQVKSLSFDNINRSCSEKLQCGGKGINVSVMLTRLGVPNRALGFVGGFTGDRLVEMLENEGVDCRFLHLKSGDTRINVKIKADTDLEINARGPLADESDIDKLMDAVAGIKAGDYLVLSGSVPENLPLDVYKRILSELDGKGVGFVVDSTGDLLLSTLEYEPFLIKPNHYELGELFGVKTDDTNAAEYALKLRERGARNVLVSCGARGAVLVDENNNVIRTGTVEGEVVSTVGCGDSMVAGFLAGYINSGDYRHALRFGSACANATAFRGEPAGRAEVQNVFDRIKMLPQKR